MFHGLKYVRGLGKFNSLYIFFSFERDEEDGNDAKGNLINYNLG